jgi:radical SAM protein with 4Fe4S-binding SPASM domain
LYENPDDQQFLVSSSDSYGWRVFCGYLSKTNVSRTRQPAGFFVVKVVKIIKEQLFNTFLTNTGTLNERIQRATSLPSKEAFLSAMAQKPDTQVRDVLIETPCNQSCTACFFNENGGPGLVRLTTEVLDELRDMAVVLGQPDPKYFTLYPKEITTALPVLPVMSEQGITRTLTNGKILNQNGVIGALRKADIQKLVITVPGGREAYALYTQNNPDEYDTLLSNVALAIRSNFDVSIFMPVFSQNIKDIEQTVDVLGNMNVKKIQFIRVRRFGNAYPLPDDYFMTRDDTLNFLEYLNRARESVGDKMSLTLFGGSFGPNFFGTSIYKQLAGIDAKWPNSRYFCPVIDRQFVGISLATKKAYSCFIGMSFKEAEIGYYKNGSITYTKPALTGESLRNNLRGICSETNCEYQPLCLGGCRMNAFALAKQKNESDPFYAGQDICVTNILKSL